ncbi:ABC transporter ATP-binding protein [Campylobacter vicugnae]|uniref:ABC transporter ATP-binding protein n=1 Tax=Campylobacter vicugnae TaxID=1660076 RepID=UPI00254E3FD6|nr:ABC transporter ATP-binding protein [Campylobacter ovis]MDL0104749.1 ABC transporter ATP-binding protein [Campylobacter ovis]MDL0106073.1 ABC transporter ATP-binding protein [Campylobacter ovis]
MIEIKNLRKSFGDICVLDDINLKINNGEFCVLLGSSGSGKSTILKILSSLESFDSGEIKFDNESFKSQIPNSKERQIIMQHYCLMPWLTALDNIKFALKCSGLKDKKLIDEIAKKYLSLVGLKDKMNLYPNSLSGGQSQRVAIARALSLDPKVLFLDEPFSALDPVVRANLQSELKALMQNKQAIFVTHDIDEAILLGDKIVILHAGKIIKELQNPKFTPNTPKYFELKSTIYKLINGQIENIEYMI